VLILAFALTLAFSAACAVLIVLYLKNKKKTAAALVRFSQIIDLEAEQSNLRLVNRRMQEEMAVSRDLAAAEHARALNQYREAEAAFPAHDQTARVALGAEYETAVGRYRELLKEIAVVEESLEDISFGIYKPHFTFQTPEEYKVRIESLRIQQRQAVREGRAVVCPTEWTVGDSKAVGKRMIRLNFKLLLRAFNGECEAAIANVSWSNGEQMEQRIRKAYADINKLGEVLHIDITGPYLIA
jgi:hypothetical protein